MKMVNKRGAVQSGAPLKVAGVGLGWNANDDPNGPVFDLDVSAFCLGEDDQIPEMTDLVYFNCQLRTKFQPDDEEEHPILQNLVLVLPLQMALSLERKMKYVLLGHKMRMILKI